MAHKNRMHELYSRQDSNGTPAVERNDVELAETFKRLAIAAEMWRGVASDDRIKRLSADQYREVTALARHAEEELRTRLNQPPLIS